jgi:hypothetical protein
MTGQESQDYHGLREDFRAVTARLQEVGERLAALEATRKGWADNQSLTLERLEVLITDLSTFKETTASQVAALSTNAKMSPLVIVLVGVLAAALMSLFGAAIMVHREVGVLGEKIVNMDSRISYVHGDGWTPPGQ